MHFNCVEWSPFRNYAVGMAIQSVHCSFSCISCMANGFCIKGPIDFFSKMLLQGVETFIGHVSTYRKIL